MFEGVGEYRLHIIYIIVEDNHVLDIFVRCARCKLDCLVCDKELCSGRRDMSRVGEMTRDTEEGKNVIKTKIPSATRRVLCASALHTALLRGLSTGTTTGLSSCVSAKESPFSPKKGVDWKGNCYNTNNIDTPVARSTPSLLSVSRGSMFCPTHTYTNGWGRDPFTGQMPISVAAYRVSPRESLAYLTPIIHNNIISGWIIVNGAARW